MCDVGIDEYICPICGHTNETCFCEDDDDIDCSLEDDFFFDDGYPFEEYFEDDSDYDLGEPICYLNGVPMYKDDLVYIED
jgi:hypothetical protein